MRSFGEFFLWLYLRMLYVLAVLLLMAILPPQGVALRDAVHAALQAYLALNVMLSVALYLLGTLTKPQKDIYRNARTPEDLRLFNEALKAQMPGRRRSGPKSGSRDAGATSLS
jgi:hypothetical protein